MAVMPDVEAQIIGIIRTMLPRARRGISINPESKLQADLGLSSLVIMTLAMKLCEHFAIDVRKLSTVVNLASVRSVSDVNAIVKTLIETPMVSKV